MDDNPAVSSRLSTPTLVEQRRRDRFLLREGYVFGGVIAGLLMRWSPWAFYAWFVVAFALWIWDVRQIGKGV